MGFSLLGDEPALFGESDRQPNVDVAIAPEDEVVGREIEEGDQVSGGADVPLEGRIIFEPSPTDMVLVNGVELTPESSLQAGFGILFFEYFRFQSEVFYAFAEPSKAHGVTDHSLSGRTIHERTEQDSQIS